MDCFKFELFFTRKESRALMTSNSSEMNEWTDGRTNRRTDGWTDERTNERTKRRKNERRNKLKKGLTGLNGWTGRRTNEQTDGRMDEWMNEWMNGHNYIFYYSFKIIYSLKQDKNELLANRTSKNDDVLRWLIEAVFTSIFWLFVCSVLQRYLSLLNSSFKTSSLWAVLQPEKKNVNGLCVTGSSIHS